MELGNRLTLETTQIAKAGFDPVYGARPLKRAIQSQIENSLAKQILEGKFAAKDRINVDLKRGVIAFEKAERSWSTALEGNIGAALRSRIATRLAAHSENYAV